MNKTQLVTEVAAKAGLTKEQAANAVNAVFGTMSDAQDSARRLRHILCKVSQREGFQEPQNRRKYYCSGFLQARIFSRQEPQGCCSRV